ncbi:MAG TPA: shikimate kinase AroK [Steroidobacteraceae bacterium]|nr:shikimate kinase AroK [Steroidobacteraceae bacterium]
MISKTNIFLIGPMGSGKTAVGKTLAKSLQLAFVDSDAEIERRTGVDIAFIFEKEGEAGFRQRERDVIADLTLRDRIVLATGGGAILEADNRRHLADRGCVVYLETSVAQQLERTRHGKHRPLLVTDDPKTRLEDLLREREPLYREIADIAVRTDGRRVQLLADEVMRLLEERAPAG